MARLGWTRALPGGVAMVAALTVPEFSVGAGDLGTGQRDDQRFDPPSAAGQGRDRWQASATDHGAGAGAATLAGVRYASLLTIAPITPRSAAGAAAARPAGRPNLPDKVMPAPSQPPVDTAQATPIIPSPPPQDIAPQAGANVPSQREPALMLALPDVARLPPASVPVTASDAALVPLPQPGAAPLATPVAVAAAAVVPVEAEAPLALAPEIDRAVPRSQPAPRVRAIEADLPAVSANVTAPAAFVPMSPPGPKPAMRAPPASAPAAPLTAAAAAKPAPSAAATAAAAAGPASSAAPLALAFTARLAARVDGKTAGALDFQQSTTGLKVRLGSIVSVLADRYDPAQIARIQASAASNAYLSLSDLQAQGIPISYDPVYDEFNIGQTDTRPKSARKVHIDQISAPERGQSTAAIGQVRR